MSPESNDDVRLPPMAQVGSDLLSIGRGRRAFIIASPFLCVLAYVASFSLEWWPFAVLSIAALSFFTYGSTSHELVHRNLRLSNRLNELLLAVTEAIALRSGHAYRAAHLHHHARFPHPDDIEGASALKSWLGAIADGITLQPRLWMWALRHSRTNRKWIVAEGLACASLVALGVVLLPIAPILAVYVALVWMGHWLLPLFTVYFVHKPHGENVLFQTRVFRSWPARLFSLEHLYHLEHHLYPSVPHPNWPELARRLDPFLRERGVLTDGANASRSPEVKSPPIEPAKSGAPLLLPREINGKQI